MSQPAVEPVTQDLYDGMAPIAFADEEHGWLLLHYVNAIGLMLQEIADYVRDSAAGESGWSILVDADRAPAKALPWLAQFVGATVPEGTSEADARTIITSPEGFDRGTPASMIRELQKTLTGSKTVLFRERDTSAYHLTVSTRIDETPDAAASLRALLRWKPAGLILDYQTIAGQDYIQLAATHADYDDVLSSYADYNSVSLDIE